MAKNDPTPKKQTFDFPADPEDGDLHELVTAEGEATQVYKFIGRLGKWSLIDVVPPGQEDA